MEMFRCRITYAMAMVGDRDTPAWQCTSTLPPVFRAPSAEQREHERFDYYFIYSPVGL